MTIWYLALEAFLVQELERENLPFGSWYVHYLAKTNAGGFPPETWSWAQCLLHLLPLLSCCWRLWCFSSQCKFCKWWSPPNGNWHVQLQLNLWTTHLVDLLNHKPRPLVFWWQLWPFWRCVGPSCLWTIQDLTLLTSTLCPASDFHVTRLVTVVTFHQWLVAHISVFVVRGKHLQLHLVFRH